MRILTIEDFTFIALRSYGHRYTLQRCIYTVYGHHQSVHIGTGVHPTDTIGLFAIATAPHYTYIIGLYAIATAAHYTYIIGLCTIATAVHYTGTINLYAIATDVHYTDTISVCTLYEHHQPVRYADIISHYTRKTSSVCTLSRHLYTKTTPGLYTQTTPGLYT